MSQPLFELVTVPSGATSLRAFENGEIFHPGVGPVAEAKALHVEQHRLGERLCAGEEFVIWDVGLGAAANALAIIEEVLALAIPGARVRLWSFDQTLEPLRYALEHAETLGYLAPWRQPVERLIQTGSVQIGPIAWRLALGDFRDRVTARETGAPGAVLFDPYSPAANPNLWTEHLFRAIRIRAAPECALTTYSRSTVVRARLMLAGWCVGRGAATGEKTETTVAATRLEMLRAPLGRAWLGRLSRSTAAGLREGGRSAGDVAREIAGMAQMLATP